MKSDRFAILCNYQRLRSLFWFSLSQKKIWRSECVGSAGHSRKNTILKKEPVYVLALWHSFGVRFSFTTVQIARPSLHMRGRMENLGLHSCKAPINLHSPLAGLERSTNQTSHLSSWDSCKKLPAVESTRESKLLLISKHAVKQIVKLFPCTVYHDFWDWKQKQPAMDFREPKKNISKNNR